MLTKYVAGKLFCRKSTAHQREQLALCTNTIRSVIKTVSVFVESVENATDDELRLELVSENGPLERTLSEFSELEPKLAVLEEFKIST